jgi:ligand-binding sensor domain-containing protein/signal transduction histidine kinase
MWDERTQTARFRRTPSAAKWGILARPHANPNKTAARHVRRGPVGALLTGSVRLAAFLLSIACLLVPHAVRALEPTTPLASYGRQSWVMENGLPQNTVQALLQTRDGFVWLGTEVGLVRFDGTSFTLFDRNSTPALPGNDVQCLFESHDGALWIGTSEGLARMKDGSFTAFTNKDGLPGSGILTVIEDSSGVLWVSTNEGWSRLAGDRFVSGADRSPNGSEVNQYAESLAYGRKVIGTKTNVEIEPGKRASILTIGKELPGTRIQTLFADREGGLWIGTNGGLVRWESGKLEHLPVTDPLSTASVLSLMEDHEGNIWVGTETGGLHILRDERFRNVGAREGLSSDAATTVVEDSAGTLWVGTTGSGLNAVSRNGVTATKVKTYTVHDGLQSDVILSLGAAPNGDLWVGTPDGLSRIHKGAIDSFTSADGLPDDFIRSLLVDADGSLWIGTRRGLTHWTGSIRAMNLETFTQANGLGSDLVGAMVRDQKGNLWVATLAGLSRLQGSKPNSYTITNFTSADGLSSNVVTALLARDRGTLLIGTQDHGWNQWDGQRFSPASRNGLNQTTIHAILEDAGNHLWFATGNGIARCDCDMAGGCSNWVEFGPADGLRSRETATNSHPSAWRSHDGLLWFATPKGLVEVDPAQFPVNTVPPPVALVRFSVDDVSQALGAPASGLKIAAGHVHFEFDYAGLSFTAPQKVRYRFMLEGFDHNWTEAGARRTAYYTNIPPGTYTFRVQAANNDGLWNTAGAELRFVLKPRFYQTIWFYVLLVAALAGLVVLFLRLRLLRAEREFRAVLGERNRIAREIHDTLAQGYVGVSVQLEVLAELLRHNKSEAAMRHLDTARGHVRDGLAEARQSIWALRSQDSGEKTLPVRLRRVTEHAGGNGIETSFSLFGAYRPLGDDTEREFLRVAQEAIHNVKKHSGAKHLVVQLEYGPAEVALEVRDDGRGFETDDGAESPPGHYGLTGMRERAAAISATLEVTSTPGGGTTIRMQASTPKEARERMGD